MSLGRTLAIGSQGLKIPVVGLGYVAQRFLAVLLPLTRLGRRPTAPGSRSRGRFEPPSPLPSEWVTGAFQASRTFVPQLTLPHTDTLVRLDNRSVKGRRALT